MLNHVSVRLEMVLVSVLDRSMVCAKRTIGSETVLDAPDGTLGDTGHVEAIGKLKLFYFGNIGMD